MKSYGEVNSFRFEQVPSAPDLNNYKPVTKNARVYINYTEQCALLRSSRSTQCSEQGLSKCLFSKRVDKVVSEGDTMLMSLPLQHCLREKTAESQSVRARLNWLKDTFILQAVREQNFLFPSMQPPIVYKGILSTKGRTYNKADWCNLMHRSYLANVLNTFYSTAWKNTRTSIFAIPWAKILIEILVVIVHDFKTSSKHIDHFQAESC